jgi:NAD(P)-dependent dehydrogenase (short-subunit alcohol dehydrogenase family)
MSRSMDTPRVWFVTGASSGFGRAIAEAALERGERVVATARDTERVADLRERHSDRVVAVPLDVTDARQASAAVEAGVAAFGRLDVVVNSAGYGLFGALEELPEEELRRQFETNLFGVLNVTRAALPQLRRQRSGHLVQITSLSGAAALYPGEGAYAGTKFAVEGLSEALAREVAHLGIRVTIVEPGPSRTGFAGGATVQAVGDEDYAASVGEALEWFAQLDGAQPNDPGLAALAIVRAVEADEPPLRLPLGEEALAAIRGKLDDQRAELDAWESVSTSTGGPGGQAEPA